MKSCATLLSSGAALAVFSSAAFGCNSAFDGLVVGGDPRFNPQAMMFDTFKNTYISALETQIGALSSIPLDVTTEGGDTNIRMSWVAFVVNIGTKIGCESDRRATLAYLFSASHHEKTSEELAQLVLNAAKSSEPVAQFVTAINLAHQANILPTFLGKCSLYMKKGLPERYKKKLTPNCTFPDCPSI
jgi:hypothetical protein